MGACSVCRAYGHSRKFHYAICPVCGHERFFSNMVELVGNTDPNPYGRKARLLKTCGETDRHEEIRNGFGKKLG